MSSGIVRELVTMWGFDVDTKPLEKLDERVKGLKESFFHLGELILGETGSIFALAESTAHAGVEAEKTAKMIGISAQKVQELQYAAKQTEVPVEAITMGLKRLSVNAYQASIGNESASRTFGMLNINIREGNGQLKSADKLFNEVANAVSKMGDKTQRTALLQQLFGRGGGQLAPLLLKQASGIKKYGDEAERLGTVLGTDAIEASEKFIDAQHGVEARLLGLRNTIGSALLPVMSDLIQQFARWYDENKTTVIAQATQFIKQMGVELRVVGAEIFKAAGFVVSLVNALGGIGKVLRIVIAGFIAWGALSFVSTIFQAVKAVMALVAAFTEMGIAQAFATGGLSLIAGAAAALAAGTFAYKTLGHSSAPSFSSGPSIPMAQTIGPSGGGGTQNIHISPAITVHTAPGTSAQQGHEIAQHVNKYVAAYVQGTSAAVANPVKY